MTLREFIKQFVEPNTLIRLVYKEGSGHRTVAEHWDKVSMEWEILENRGNYRKYADNEVIGVTDIITEGAYSEAVNIVITN